MARSAAPREWKRLQDISGYAVGDPLGGVMDRIARQMSAARRGLDVAVAEQLVDRRADSTPIGTLTCWIRAIMRGQHSTPVNSQILGGPPGYEAGAVAIASDVDRQGPNEPAGQASQQFDREPGEPGTAGHGEEAGAADAQDGRDARVRRVAELRQDRGERGAALVARSGRGPVEVDPGIAREVYTPHASTNAHSRCVRGL